MRRKQGREVVYVERGGRLVRQVALLGRACSAPGSRCCTRRSSGEETRRVLQRKLWKLRAMTEEKLDELAQQFGRRRRTRSRSSMDEDEDDSRRGRATPAAAAAARRGRSRPGGAGAAAGRVARAPARGRRRPRGAARLSGVGPAGGTGRPPASSAAPCRPPTKTTSRFSPAR